jgi:hypothetical protein
LPLDESSGITKEAALMSIYQNLDALLSRDARAYDYFSKLPDYAKDSVREHARDIRSWTELRTFLDNYLAGDN